MNTHQYKMKMAIEKSLVTDKGKAYLKKDNTLEFVKDKKETQFSITLPLKSDINRIPGLYEDLFSQAKLKHNSYILHAVRLLNNNSLSQGIVALILDGKECRTSQALLHLGSQLTKLDIVELDTNTFDIIKKFHVGQSNVNVFNQHINQFVEDSLDPLTNIVYFDVMCSYFSSKSVGSDKIIKEYLNKVKRDEIIFAATFCLRNKTSCDHETQSKQIMSEIDKQFKRVGYSSKFLLEKDEVIYQGQRSVNKGMMFVLYHLKKENIQQSNEIKI